MADYRLFLARRFDRFLEVVHPNERELIKKLVDQAIRSHKDVSSEYRWNQNHERLTGFSAKELKDQKVLDWFTSDETKKVIADDVERIFAKRSVRVEAPLTLKDGSQVPYLFTATR